MQTDDPLISDIEDLDPDPPPRRGRLDRREFLLGCLLLLLTVGWAGWQWWQQDSKERNYRMGQQAEKEYRWTEARSGYSAASGYRDATARAASVTEVINELQDNFVSARWHAQGGDWAAALRAVQAVQRLDPHYGDVTSLEAEAERHVYGEALQGAVAMRPQAQPPGLYYSGEAGWIWLEESDQGSSIRSFLSSGVLVYDVPGETPYQSLTPAPGPPAFTSPDSAQSTGYLKGRRLVAASLVDGAFHFAPLALDPTMYDFYIAGGQGVWAVRKDANPGSEQPPPKYAALRDTLTFLVGRELDYQSLGSPISSTVRLPGPEWAVLNADLGQNRLLLADVKIQHEESALVDLYISDAVGDNRRLLYSHQGALGSAQFSPDGRYVLLSTYSPLGGTSTEKLSLILLDLQDNAIKASPIPARVVIEKVIAARAPGSAPLPQMRATFLRKGPALGRSPMQAGMVLVTEWGSERGALSVLDPASPDNPLASVEIPGGQAGTAWVNELEDGTGLVVAWQPWLSGFGTKDAGLVVARWMPGKPVTMQSFTFDKESDVVSSVVRGDYLICTVLKAAQSEDNAEFTMYSLPLFGPSNTQPQAVRLFSTAMSKRTSPFLSGFTWQFGSKMLSYSDNGQLHARTYDGSIDVALEGGVSGFFDFDWISPLPLPH